MDTIASAFSRDVSSLGTSTSLVEERVGLVVSWWTLMDGVRVVVREEAALLARRHKC